MTLNRWWDGNPVQRYWMEVATTGAMGERLIAPKTPEATWSYELVAEVREGDRILHWKSGAGFRGLVGWSVATSNPEVTPEYTWQPRGTAGRAAGPRTTEGWVVTLGGFNPLARPLSSEELQSLRAQVLEVDTALKTTHGKPTYFPFYLYGGRELRAQQGYLVKFPVELFDILPNVEDVLLAVQESNAYDGITEDERRPREHAPRGRLTRVQDPALRTALETHAVNRAIAHYTQLGARDVRKLGKPYDISLILGGVERHIEVKGSSLLIETVELTKNEIHHAYNHQPTDLVVVDGIEWRREEDEIITTGGRLRVWESWVPAEDDLLATKFSYLLPPSEA